LRSTTGSTWQSSQKLPDEVPNPLTLTLLTKEPFRYIP
jgi:hypothetical protein